ncbi:MAG: flavodoxin [Deltaproteobacteria bacterium]|jgi:flavodoxin short chain|nr:flavodoxin [Deltaproteobacteria bacterium]
MSNVLIVYGSTTGNTEGVANDIADLLKQGGKNVTVLNASEAKAQGLCAGRDCVLFGCSTWGYDAVELQDDFASLFEAFDAIGASGVKAAVFGCGDSGYPHFCGAVDAIAQKLEELGAQLMADSLKIDGDPAEAGDDIKAWAKNIMAAV